MESGDGAFPRFEPHPLLRGSHGQTIAGAYLWQKRRWLYRATRHLVSLEDGDQLVLHEDRPDGWVAGQPVALLVHGLAGCHLSGYMRRVAAKLTGVGCRVYRLDLRGCGAGMTVARHSLHAGRTADLEAALQFVTAQVGPSPRSIVGFSLGASMVLRWLGEQGEAAGRWVDQAIAVAAPLDLAICSRLIRTGANRLYDRNFVFTLWRFWNERRRKMPGLYDRPECVRCPKTLYDFDAALTAPLGGFADVEDYYTRSSCLLGLPAIAVPTHLLWSWDDPLIATDLYRSAAFSPCTRRWTTEGGGHLGFLARRTSAGSDPDWHWMDWRIVQWIAGNSSHFF